MVNINLRPKANDGGFAERLSCGLARPQVEGVSLVAT